MTRALKLQQVVCGLALLVFSAVIWIMASGGTSPEDKDITVTLILVPMGLWLIFTKQPIMDSFLEGGSRHGKRKARPRKV